MSRRLQVLLAFLLCAPALEAQAVVRGTVFDSLITSAPLEGATVIVSTEFVPVAGLGANVPVTPPGAFSSDIVISPVTPPTRVATTVA